MISLVQVFEIYLLPLLSGLLVTLQLAVCGISLGFVFGLVLAFVIVFAPAPISKVITAAVYVIRGVPLLVILLIVYIGIATLLNLVDFMSAVVSLTLYSSVYQCMVFAGAIQSVSGGQMEAAEALGFTRFKAIWNVILPQALRFALPAWSNEAITVVKDTSLAYAIGVTELMRHADYLAVTTMEPLLVYGGAAALYYVVCTILAKALRVIEYRKKIPGFGQK